MEKLGATGEYPKGKLCKDDKGELRLAVAADIKNMTVVIDFGKPVKWLALHKEETKGFIEILQKHLEKLERNS
jgi:hypothetical protein